MKIRSVVIVLFDDVEVLDFAGPFEVFSVAKDLSGEALFKVRTVAVAHAPYGDGARAITARNGLKVTADHVLDEIDQADILIVPGGMGTRALVADNALSQWIGNISSRAKLTLSVCTGSLLLAKAGLLANSAATTHHGAMDLLSDIDPTIDLRRDVRFVDNGAIVTSGGISAGIDMSFHVLERLHGSEIATQTADYMEYRRV